MVHLHRPILKIQVIGAAIEVHRQLGLGFLESVYEDALCIELGLRDIPHERQYPVHVLYKGHAVGEGRIDILVDGCLIIELKAVEKLSPVHKAQVISYIKATQLELGLLINFNESVLKAGIKRVILTT
ncbi:MAG: GxxExxY protein [Chloroflexota bacterium]